jgi:hypothetical protein
VTPGQPPGGPVLQVPLDVLAAEIEFAVAYLRACNPGEDLTGRYRSELARLIADMLAERAGQGLSGMVITAGAEAASSGPGPASAAPA